MASISQETHMYVPVLDRMESLRATATSFAPVTLLKLVLEVMLRVVS